jgi:DNA-binding CsgD family transcriptional regulator
MAAHLGISENTVAGCAKKIHRHFGVRSHAGLLRRFHQGDGGDRA